MQCYEYELVCSVFENAVTAVEPGAVIDRLEVCELLAANQVRSLADLRALEPARVREMAARFLGGAPLAA